MRGGGADDVVAKLGDIAARAGLRRVSVLAWRDLDDPEAGGSEVHASKVAALWGEAGIEVTMRTSHAPGYPTVELRPGESRGQCRCHRFTGAGHRSCRVTLLLLMRGPR